MEIKTVSLKEYSSLRIGGEGRVVIVTNKDELKEAVMHAKTEGLRVHLLGGGTNSYFGDDLSGYLFIKPEFSGFEFIPMDDDSTVLIASAGEVWDDMVAESVTRNLWGIENLSLIPGTVGAAPFQNIGAYGRELADVFLSLLAYDIQNCDVVELGKEQCRFGYRDSLFKQKPGRYTILSVKIKLSSVYAPNLSYKPLDSLVGKQGLSPADVRYLVVETRQSKLPDWKEHSNAGSFFKNPVVTTKQGEALRVSYPEIPLHEVPGGYKVPAAWLIEHVASMKGVNHGDVGTWPMQPLVLVNYGKATADDIDTFAREIRGVIFEKTGIRLEQEVNRVG